VAISGFALDYIFHPRSVAVVGASTSERGDQFIDALREMPFRGEIYAVNPKSETIMGLPCYPTLRDISGPVDHVMTSVPATVLPQIVEDCGAKGVKVIHFFTSGLKETGEAQREELEAALVKRARQLGIRIIGPNCLGLYVPAVGLAWISGLPKEPGSVGLISQSGANAAEFIAVSAPFGLRFSKVISYGNAADLDESDFLEYCAEDPETEIILAYIEGVKDGRRFRRVLTEAAATKPVVILKGGLTEAGGRATQSHTASLAGSAEVFGALCHQAGAVQVRSMAELQDMGVALQFIRSLPGPNAGVIGGGGGRSVLAADELTLAGLRVPPLPGEVQEQLQGFTPVAGTSVCNPVDTSVIWYGGEQAGELLARTIGAVASAPNVDFVLLEQGLQWGPRKSRDRPDFIPKWMERALETAIERCADLKKPLVVALTPLYTVDAYEATLRFQETCYRQNIAVFPDVRHAATVLSKLLSYTVRRHQLPESV